MYKNSLKTCIFAMVPMSALAQTIPLDTVMMTGTANPLSGIRSSAAFSTPDYEQIQESAPGSAADILRNVPPASFPKHPAAKATLTSRCAACRSAAARIDQDIAENLGYQDY